MKVEDTARIELLNLSEIDDWVAFLAQDSLDAKLLEGAAKRLRLWYFPAASSS